MDKIIVLRADGTAEVRPVKDGEPTLKQLQSYVGGYIEVVPTAVFSNVILVVNEDGKNLGLRMNLAASYVARTLPGDVIVGDAVLARSVGEDLTGIPDIFVDFLLGKFLEWHVVSDVKEVADDDQT